MTTTAPEIWFLTGSQGMYGPETLEQVADQSQEVARELGASLSTAGPVRVVWKPVLLDAAAIHRQMLEANSAPECVGVITWMHTFSPAKMWIAGLDALQKPLLHLHTQAGMELPWSTIDMDFMNLNQAAHGDREHGYIQTRLGIARKTVAGHVRSPEVARRTALWARAALGRHELRTLKLVRFGDNMRNVAVTEGDKVEAQRRFGVAVNTHGVNDLVAVVDQVGRRRHRQARDRVRRHVRRRAGAAARRRPAGVAALRRADRARAAAVPHRGRLRCVHHQLRGPRRAAPAPRARRTATDGRRLRLRRRGRLEDVRAAAGGEGDGGRRARRQLVHGGLHVPPGARRGEGPRRAHAGGLPVDRRRPTEPGGAPALDRRPRGPGAAALHRRARRGRRRRTVRPRRPAAADAQRDRRGRARRGAAAAARRLRGLGAPAVAVGLRRVLADGREHPTTRCCRRRSAARSGRTSRR